MNQLREISFYATPPHECNYLPARWATTLFVDPVSSEDKEVYGALSQQGFRRSGEYIYKPYCEACQACVAVRVPVFRFQPRRSQRRVWKKNSDLTVTAVPPEYNEERFQLYRDYIACRHEGGGMDNPTPQGYKQFLCSPWADTVFYEFRLHGRLLAVAVADRFAHGLSAVYTFFDPRYSSRGLGVYAVLWEIRETMRMGLKWLYLGYWIKDCQKMSYKMDYQPLQCYQEGEWRNIF
ncbi:MAG: arginyltransferase [Gammaproteobacteria bacterium]|nr:arginyltransferase [Gammaproteobacteria bacterium]